MKSVNPHSLRSAQPADAIALSQIAFRAKAHWGYSAEFMEACRRELSCTASQIEHPDNHFVLAYSNQNILGFYAIAILAPLTFELEALFVDPPFMRTGVGQALLDHATGTVAALNGSSFLIQSDPHARAFYQAMGARQVGVRESGSIPGRQLPLLRIDVRPVCD